MMRPMSALMLSFPVDTTFSGSTSAIVPAAVPSTTDTVLLVEDDPMLAQLFGVLLKKCGVEVLAARDGTECLRLFRTFRSSVSLVVMDCGLPDVHGGSLCHQLRSATPNLPILLTSGRKQGALHALLALDGPTSFLAKPFFPADVLREVSGLLAQRSPA
jgi:two-component system cell cycle sensor histidine kinase/response regulator CckA